MMITVCVRSSHHGRHCLSSSQDLHLQIRTSSKKKILARPTSHQRATLLAAVAVSYISLHQREARYGLRSRKRAETGAPPSPFSPSKLKVQV